MDTVNTNILIEVTSLIVIIGLSVYWSILVIKVDTIKSKIEDIEKQLTTINQRSKKSDVPLVATDIKIDKFERGKCPVCGSTVWHSDKICKNCGQKIKWDNKNEVNK